MRVLILGAGASICAGYPQAEALLDTLAQDAVHVGLQLKEAWNLWAEVVASAPEEVHPLLTARNPEIVLSFLDLCEMFITENFAEVFRGDKGREAADQSMGSDCLDSGLFSNSGHVWLHHASAAKDRLILLLGEYFLWKHVEDSQRPDRRAYMREMLRDLKAGDVVVTFNWDTVVERSLLELGRWNPTDGYGFQAISRCRRFSGKRPPTRRSIISAVRDTRA
jgi:hypothetical protein